MSQESSESQSSNRLAQTSSYKGKLDKKQLLGKGIVELREDISEEKMYLRGSLNLVTELSLWKEYLF